jgi:hypothetical protein
MTEREFIEFYAEGSDISVEELLSFMHPEPCDCDDELCQGWSMEFGPKETTHD